MFCVSEIASHLLFRSHGAGAAPGLRAFTLGILAPAAVVLGPGMHGELNYTRLTYPALLELETWFDDPPIVIEYTRRHSSDAPVGRGALDLDTGTVEITPLPGPVPGAGPEDAAIERDPSMITVFVDELPVFVTPADPGEMLGLGEETGLTGFIDTTWHGGAGGGGSGSSFNDDDFDGQFASIPEPGVAGTLALGALATTRRRRGA